MTRLACALLLATALQAPQAPATPAPFHWHDDYTEYHLLAPGSHSFHIVYFLNQRQPGLTYVLNQTRSGSEGSGIAVSDPRTGEPLKFDYMTGRELAEAGVPGRLNAGEHYIRAHLPRPVPAGGEGRVRIEKTYTDEKSYFSSGDTITFARSLGIGRNTIVLPADYGLVSSNVAARIDTLPDGRLRLSFENINGYASDVTIRAAKSRAKRRQLVYLPTAGAVDFTKSLYELRPDGSVRATRQALVPSPLTDIDWLTELDDLTIFDMDLGTTIDRGALSALKVNGNAQIRVTGRPRGQRGGWAQNKGILVWAQLIHEPRATVVLPPNFELSYAINTGPVGTLPDGRMYVQIVNPYVGSGFAARIEAVPR